MKKIVLMLMGISLAVTAWAVPAKPNKRVFTQPDGQTVEYYVRGDETYHYMVDTEENLLTVNEEGYLVVGEKQTQENISRRRAAGKIRHQVNPKKVGSINLAPRGLFILVNFKDSKFNSSNSLSEMEKMLNKSGYNYGGAPGSVKDYFIEQSGGQYSPQFDVFGPVTLTKNVSSYGANDKDGNDKAPEQMVIEACQALDSQIDFSLYDGDNDGYVDFVYVIYAGKGEADGGATNTIWPHQWFIYQGAGLEVKLDGKLLDNYACGPELDGTTGGRNGIGTLCHEFGHVLGLPDYYDTNYGSNSTRGLTPNEWSIMDMGSYNNGGITPPNWSAHDKYYVGWYTPEILNSPENVTLPADNKTFRMITSDGKAAKATDEKVVYYIENRQNKGWDEYLPGHGMVVWKVNYKQSVWDDNAPNNTAGSPRFTVVSASGKTTNIGNSETYNNNDPFPGKNKKTSYTPYTNYPLENIAESTNGTITFKFMGGLDKYTVKFDAGSYGTSASSSLTEKEIGSGIVLPQVTAVEGYTFVGWATAKNSATADAGKAGDTYNPKTNNQTLYAVYTRDGYVILGYDLYGVNKQTGSEAGFIAQTESFVATFVASENSSSLSEETCLVEVKVGGTELTDCYSFENGVLTIEISASKLTGNVEITIVGDEAQASACDNYNYEYTKTVGIGDVVLGDYNWNISIAKGAVSVYDSDRGEHFGTQKSPAGKVTYTTADAKDCSIEYIVVEAAGAGTNAKIEAFIGNTSLGSKTLSQSSTEYKFENTGNLKGEIKFILSANTKALYVKAINIKMKSAEGNNDTEGQEDEADADEVEIKVLDTAIAYYSVEDGEAYWDIDLYNEYEDYPEVYLSFSATSNNSINGNHNAGYIGYWPSANDSVETKNVNISIEYVGESDYVDFYSYHISGSWVVDGVTYYFDTTLDLRLIDWDAYEADSDDYLIVPENDINGQNSLLEQIDAEELVDVYDLMGRKLYAGHNKSVMPMLRSGVYVLKSANQTQKIVVR